MSPKNGDTCSLVIDIVSVGATGSMSGSGVVSILSGVTAGVISKGVKVWLLSRSSKLEWRDDGLVTDDGEWFLVGFDERPFRITRSVLGSIVGLFVRNRPSGSLFWF